QFAERQKATNRKVVLCHGTFDLLHIGHIRHLNAAKKHGDVLVVTLTADRHVKKGPGRPVFNESLRAENLAALECVDGVAVVDDVTALPAIEAIRPDVYGKGVEYAHSANDVTGNIDREAEAVRAYGGHIAFTDDITFSSSNLLNEHFSVFPPPVKAYLERLAQKYQANVVHEQLNSLKSLKVCVVGDAIIDEYVTTEILGQTGKGNIMAVKRMHAERFAGGSLAVANHLAGFANEVTLVAGLGTGEDFEPFIHSKLKPNVSAHFFHRTDVPTVVKTRFVDADVHKLFEVYAYEDHPMPSEIENEICSWLGSHLPEFDVVVVPDFGNGFISNGITQSLCAHSRFLAVNTQVNSGNRGFHSVNRYRRADFVSLNEPELRLALHNRHDSVDWVATRVADGLQARYLAVTRGTKGLMLLDRIQDNLIEVPALSFKVIDRIGAGDAFLSLAALCLGGGLESDLAAFVGSAAAAIDVQIVCNRASVESSDLYKYVTTLLK
ncbi:MAG: adenylyltransferase/cytidyltransferase family protein, partial [Acidobacteria bacterium]|nr:adenylyltransferase/cytidyltransferase family protein [Acidobacteriota bacterium]